MRLLEAARGDERFQHQVIHEDVSMGVVINLSLKDLLEDFGMRETINLSLKDLLEDFGMRETINLSLKDLLEDFGMGEVSNLNPKDLLEDFGVRAMRDLNVRVIFENLSIILQACRGMEVNVVRNALASYGRNGSSGDGGKINYEISREQAGKSRSAVSDDGTRATANATDFTYRNGRGYVVGGSGAEKSTKTNTFLDVRVEEGAPTLIDSGATHILRQPRDGAEMASATRVSVTLANDEKRDLLQAESGAILSTSAETQPILPMAELVSAGCEISWKKGNFKVVHPVWGELRTTIRGGCPELAQEQSARLVNEIEDKKLKELKDGVSLLKSKLEHLVHEEKLPWTTYIERYLEGGLAKDLWKALQGSFMKILSEHMLDPLCQGIRPGKGWNHMKDLSFPRRLRKRMLDSTKWVVHLPVHRDEEHPKAEEYGPDAVVVNVPGELLTKAYEFVKVTGMRESELNLGDFGAPGRKPLIATTNYHLDGLRPRSASEEGTIDQSVLGWPVTLKLKLARAVRENSFEDQRVALGGSMKAMSPEKWKEHVRAGHYPARRDCLQCVMHGATGHRRARVEHPSLFCLTVDITGPFRTQGEDPGARGDRAKAAKMKYLLVAKITIPESYVTGEFEPTGSDRLDEEVGSKDLFDEEDKVSTGGDDRHTDGAGGDDRDPGEAVVENEPLDAEEESEEADAGAGVGPIPLDVKAPKATYLLFAEPLLNDKGPTIASAIQSIVLYLQSLNIPVLSCRQSSGIDAEGKGARQVPKMIASLGSKVLVKKRRYAASGPLIRLDFEERWSEGVYLGLSDQVADGHGMFTHTRSVRDKAKLVDAKEHQPDEDREPLVFEDDQDPPSRRLRIYGKSAPRMAALGGNPDNEGDSSGRGHSPDREYHDGDPDGRGHSPDYRDSPNVVEEVRFSNWAPGDDVSERVVVAPRVAVRDGKLVLEHYDDDLPSDHEDSSPRMAVLEHNPDHEPDEDGGQEKIRDLQEDRRL
ncbi:hypothetical protein AK812_SmicGene40188 [Symbiodinium microadriaticum]|uniref:Uncharacterized protein n=1 Tax=Symbiodinium microadriaticum TaxID=2951 RepID=A0A1Q9C9B2_SYMMI|nr:hypothetical protein AK812_SmicGene40188 [Symbiodinium microadriaticum]